MGAMAPVRHVVHTPRRTLVRMQKIVARGECGRWRLPWVMSEAHDNRERVQKQCRFLERARCCIRSVVSCQVRTRRRGMSVDAMNDKQRHDSIDLARIREICTRFPDAAEGLLQGRPLFHVRRRRFAIFNGDQSPPRPRWMAFGRSLHVATDPLQRTRLAGDTRFVASPHHGFRGWMALDLHAHHVDWSEVNELLESAYRQVATKELVAELTSRAAMRNNR